MESILYGFVIAFLSFFYLGWENDRFSVGKTLTVNLLGTIVVNNIRYSILARPACVCRHVGRMV